VGAKYSLLQATNNSSGSIKSKMLGSTKNPKPTQSHPQNFVFGNQAFSGIKYSKKKNSKHNPSFKEGLEKI
jgi:hypothetical protein